MAVTFSRKAFVLLALLGCGSGASFVDSPGATAEALVVGTEAGAPAAPQDFHYFRASLMAASCDTGDCGGYVVTPLDGALVSCGGGAPTSACRVSDIQLSTADVTRPQEGELLAKVTPDDGTFSIVFTGRIVPHGAGPNLLLEAHEAWLSSRPVPTSKALHHVTRATTPCAGAAACTKADSVAFGSWEAMRSATFLLEGVEDPALVFSPKEPLANNCGIIAPPPQIQAAAFALSKATGLLAAGTRSAATFSATDVFLKYMGWTACDHDHHKAVAQCCGATYECMAYRMERCPKGDHILGGYDFEYERSFQVSSFLARTNQPLSPTAHDHAAVAATAVP